MALRATTVLAHSMRLAVGKRRGVANILHFGSFAVMARNAVHAKIFVRNNGGRSFIGPPFGSVLGAAFEFPLFIMNRNPLVFRSKCKRQDRQKKNARKG